MVELTEKYKQKKGIRDGEALTGSVADIYHGYSEFLNLQLAENPAAPIHFISCSITSGAYKRTNLPHEEMVTKNKTLVRGIMTSLFQQNQIDSESLLIIPGRMRVQNQDGTPWENSDYLLFYNHTLAGLPNRESAAQVEAYVNESLGVDGITALRNHSLPREVRALAHTQMTDSYLSAVDRLGLNISAIRPNATLALLDNCQSLGCLNELIISKALGIPTLKMALRDPAHESIAAWAGEIATLQTLGMDFHNHTPGEAPEDHLPPVMLVPFSLSEVIRNS